MASVFSMEHEAAAERMCVGRPVGCGWAEPDSDSRSISLSHVKTSRQERAGSHSDMKLTHFGTRKGWGHTPFLQMGCWQLSPGTSPPSLLPSMASSTPCCDMSSWAFMSLECSFSFLWLESSGLSC